MEWRIHEQKLDAALERFAHAADAHAEGLAGRGRQGWGHAWGVWLHGGGISSGEWEEKAAHHAPCMPCL